MTRPSTLLLDVNETLSDLGPMADRFAELGAPREVAATWFAALLRDGFALTAAGSTAPFADLAADAAHRLLAPMSLDREVDDAVAHVMAGFTSLDVHPDVGPGLTALRDGGLRIVTLSNGATSVAEGLLDRSGLAHAVERTLSVEEAGVWKPAAGAYHWACAQLGVAPTAAMLVAAHPWDTDGAARAGLQSAWIDRAGGSSYPAHFTPPTVTASGFDDLAGRLGQAE